MAMNPTPYELAHEEYHSYGAPWVEWPLLVGLHFQYGVVISTPDAFIMARRVNRDDPPEVHFSPLQSRPDGDCWMIWIAAGKLDALRDLWKAHPTRWISYTRRTDTRLRFLESSKFLSHGQHAKTPIPSQADTGASPRERHRLGETTG